MGFPNYTRAYSQIGQQLGGAVVAGAELIDAISLEKFKSDLKDELDESMRDYSPQQRKAAIARIDAAESKDQLASMAGAFGLQTEYFNKYKPAHRPVFGMSEAEYFKMPGVAEAKTKMEQEEKQKTVAGIMETGVTGVEPAAPGAETTRTQLGPGITTEETGEVVRYEEDAATQEEVLRRTNKQLAKAGLSPRERVSEAAATGLPPEPTYAQKTARIQQERLAEQGKQRAVDSAKRLELAEKRLEIMEKYKGIAVGQKAQKLSQQETSQAIAFLRQNNPEKIRTEMDEIESDLKHPIFGLEAQLEEAKAGGKSASAVRLQQTLKLEIQRREKIIQELGKKYAELSDLQKRVQGKVGGGLPDVEQPKQRKPLEEFIR